MATAISEQKFTIAYGNFLVHCWEDDAYKARFLKNPAQILKESGLDPEGATIVLKEPKDMAKTTKEERTMTDQVRLWNEGKEKGTIEFYFQQEPPQHSGMVELSEEDLEAIAGGYSMASCCCSSCPACCCGP